MTYRSRPISFAFYRLFFIVILFSLGLLCLGVAAMEFLLGYSIIPAADSTTHKAIITGSLISGVLSILYAYILLRIMTDRRVQASDRRQQQVAIDFPDRRSGIDRRTGLPG